MNVLVLSRYDRLGASSRLRMFQYFPWLNAAGLTVTTEPFFGDSYLEASYRRGSTRKDVLAAYARRVAALVKQRSPDVVWVEKEIFPWLPQALEQLIVARGVPVVSDYDDAIFHRYDRHRLPIVRALLGRKIDRVMARSELVMAGNDYLAERARNAGAKAIEIVPTVVDVTAYDNTPLPAADGKPRIGWIGTPSTWREYLEPMMPMLSDVASRHDAMIRIVGAAPQPYTNGPVEALAWSEADEGRMIQGMDIGLMPLDDSPWSRGKCGYKLIQYMACGLPVIASPVGVNTDIVEHGVNGFLAATDAEWHEALDTLLRDPRSRQKMGAEGRRKVEHHYSLQVWGPRVAQMLMDVVGAVKP